MDGVARLGVDATIDAIVDAYEQAVSGGRLWVVSVESRTGWGKSHAVCRFYIDLRHAVDETGVLAAGIDRWWA